MKTEASTQQTQEAEFRQHDREWREYAEQLRLEWIRNNNMRNHPDCFEVMREVDKQRVYGLVRQWDTYITPIAEKWWKERGYTVHWPEKNTDPPSYTKD